MSARRWRPVVVKLVMLPEKPVSFLTVMLISIFVTADAFTAASVWNRPE